MRLGDLSTLKLNTYSYLIGFRRHPPTRIKVCCFAPPRCVIHIQDKDLPRPPNFELFRLPSFSSLSTTHPPIHTSSPSTYPSVRLSRPLSVPNHPSHEQASSRPHLSSIKQIHTVCLSLPTRWTSCPHKRPVALSRMAWGHAPLTALHPDGITINNQQTTPYTLDTCFNSSTSQPHSTLLHLEHHPTGTRNYINTLHASTVSASCGSASSSHVLALLPPCNRLSPTSISLAQGLLATIVGVF